MGRAAPADFTVMLVNAALAEPGWTRRRQAFMDRLSLRIVAAPRPPRAGLLRRRSGRCLGARGLCPRRAGRTTAAPRRASRSSSARGPVSQVGRGLDRRRSSPATTSCSPARAPRRPRSSVWPETAIPLDRPRPTRPRPRAGRSRLGRRISSGSSPRRTATSAARPTHVQLIAPDGAASTAATQAPARAVRASSCLCVDSCALRDRPLAHDPRQPGRLEAGDAQSPLLSPVGADGRHDLLRGDLSAAGPPRRPAAARA